MKWNALGRLACIIPCFLPNLSVAYAERLSVEQPYDAPEVLRQELFRTYQEPKNIMFASMFGGSSHVNWVLTILDELSTRGHNITFVTSNLHEKFASPFPHFHTIVLSHLPTTSKDNEVSEKHMDILDIIGKVFEFANQNFESDYPAYKSLMANMDVALCDFGSSSGCYEAAIDTNTPYIVTEAFAMSPDASAPYINNNVLTMREPSTLDMNFIDRFNDMFIKPALALRAILPVSKQIDEKRRRVGCKHTSFEGKPSVHSHNLKLVNSLYGIEAARPMGPLVEMVGPILPRYYEPLTLELESFLNSHKRIIYIAFGQHATSSLQDQTMILTAILESIESNIYDGFLWATRHRHNFPDTITTQSGSIYNIESMLNSSQTNTRFVQWAPQTAVVMHPSISVFLTHGGAGSFFEGLFGGKRLIVFPFFGDQFPNAHNVQRNGMGAYLRHDASQKEANEVLARIGRDSDGFYQKNVRRYQALVQIHSRHGPVRAANLVEEVIYTNKDGLVPHRYEDSRYMSFFKAHNLDIYIAAALVVLVPAFLLIWCIKKCLAPTPIKQKLN